jgi:hypothetical protein
MFRLFALLAALALAAPSHAVIFKVKPYQEGDTLVYGSIRSPMGGPSGILVKGAKAKVICLISGTFFAMNVKPEKTFCMPYFFMDNTRYALMRHGEDKEDSEWCMEVKPGEFYYVGSYKITAEEGGNSIWGVGGKFEIKRMKGPSPLELLRELLEQRQFKGTGWDSALKDEIAALEAPSSKAGK